jgi:serine/threonine protein kinase
MQTNMFKICGTVGYIAPEVLNDEIYDLKVDIFSVGVIMYTMYHFFYIKKVWVEKIYLREIRTQKY